MELETENFAYLISVILHPLVLAVPMSLIYLYLGGVGRFETLKWFLVGFTTGFIPFVAILRFREKQWKLSREQRPFYYIIGVLIAMTVAIIYYLLSAPWFILEVYLLGITLTAIFLLVNKFAKISVHTGFTVFLGLIFLQVDQFIGIALLTLASIVAWSRIVLDRHDLEEVLLGGLIPTMLWILIYI